MKNKYICALDIGSSKIAGGLANLSKKDNISELFLESVPSKGFKGGRILDSAELSGAITNLLKKLESKSGVAIKSVFVNIYGQDILTRNSQATLALAEKGNKIVTKKDIQEVTEEAKILGSRFDEEIVDYSPIYYKVDEQNGIINPLGLYGHTLGADLYLICVKSSFIQTVARLMDHAGCQIKQIFHSGTATAKVIFNEEQLKSNCSIFVDIGSSLTQICLFKQGLLHKVKILPIGGDDFTFELACTLKIPFELAEEIKKSYASITESGISSQDREVMIKKDDLYKPISQQLICEVTTAKAKLLMESINQCLSGMIREVVRADSILVGGRTILIDGFLELMEITLGLPVKMIRLSDNKIFEQKYEAFNSTSRFLNYATTLGLIREGIESSKRRHWFNSVSHLNPLQQIISRAKDIYQEYF